MSYTTPVLHFYMKQPTFEIELTETSHNHYHVKLNGRSPATGFCHQTDIIVKKKTPLPEVKIAALEWATRTMSEDKDSITAVIDRLKFELDFEKDRY